MATGIKVGSGFRYTSPVATNINAAPLTASARKAAGQVRHIAWDYCEQGTGTYWRILPLAQCFVADPNSDDQLPATQAGSWGTLDSHWLLTGQPAQGGYGSAILFYDTNPLPANGKLRDAAVNTVTGDVFEKTAETVWTLRGNLKGLPGNDGDNGADGGTIRYYTAPPAPSDGNVRDTAINTANGDIYEKTGLMVWTLRGRLTGGTGGGTGTGGVTTFNNRAGAVNLQVADVTALLNRPNQLIGGFQNITTLSLLRALPLASRDYGMKVYVYGDIAANNGYYKLADDLLSWVKEGADAAGQFAAYNGSTPYNTQSAYVTYPDAVSGALRIFHCTTPSGTAILQPAPLNGSNVVAASWEEISPSAVSSAIPVYATTGQNTNGYIHQKGVTDLFAASIGAITARFNNGTVQTYATAQLASAALDTAGGGGVIISQVDIEGPLTLSGNVSLYAPGRTVYLRTNVTGDTLTLNGCTGSVECRLIERSTAGVGYALVGNAGSPTVKANALNTQGYNAVFGQNCNLQFEGNAELTNNMALPEAGERICVLQVGGRLSYRGSITLNSTVNTSAMEGLTAASSSVVDFNGNITITNKGRIARNQGATLAIRGRAISLDRGVISVSGKTDLYLSIDTRGASSPTADNAPLTVVRNAATQPNAYVTLHTGTELLAPAGIASIYNSNSSFGTFNVGVTGVLVQTALPDANTTITYLTLQAATGGGGGATLPVPPAGYTGFAAPCALNPFYFSGGFSLVNGTNPTTQIEQTNFAFFEGSRKGAYLDSPSDGSGIKTPIVFAGRVDCFAPKSAALRGLTVIVTSVATGQVLATGDILRDGSVSDAGGPSHSKPELTLRWPAEAVTVSSVCKTGEAAAGGQFTMWSTFKFELF